MATISLLGEGVLDALSLVSFLNKQKISIIGEARNVAERVDGQRGVERLMSARAESMARQLRSGKIKFSEYQKAVAIQTLIGAMAGAELAKPSASIRESVWNQAVGKFAQYLPDFLRDTKEALDRGDLQEEEPEDYAERRGIASWAGLVARLIRYVANPSYEFFKLSEYNVQRQTGMTQMRRVAVGDDRTCPDCIWWDQVGWQRIGEIPLPGNSCRCMDRCRCRMEYR